MPTIQFGIETRDNSSSICSKTWTLPRTLTIHHHDNTVAQESGNMKTLCQEIGHGSKQSVYPISLEFMPLMESPFRIFSLRSQQMTAQCSFPSFLEATKQQFRLLRDRMNIGHSMDPSVTYTMMFDGHMDLD